MGAKITVDSATLRTRSGYHRSARLFDIPFDAHRRRVHPHRRALDGGVVYGSVIAQLGTPTCSAHLDCVAGAGRVEASSSAWTSNPCRTLRSASLAERFRASASRWKRAAWRHDFLQSERRQRVAVAGSGRSHRDNDIATIVAGVLDAAFCRHAVHARPRSIARPTLGLRRDARARLATASPGMR